MAEQPVLHAFSVHLRPRHVPPMHAHEQHEFFFCIRGTGRQETDAASQGQAMGDLFFFPAGQSHHCIGDAPDGCDGRVIFAHPNVLPHAMAGESEAHRVLARLRRRAESGENRLRLSPEGRGGLAALFETMERESRERTPGFSTALSVAYQSALLLLLRDPDSAPLFRDDAHAASAEDRIDHILRYLQQHATLALSVDQMAEMACMSRSHFHACFQRRTGTTPIEYAHRLRVAEAARLLRETTQPIAETALACGYESLGHFYQVFRRLEGMTPRQCRRGADFTKKE